MKALFIVLSFVGFAAHSSESSKPVKMDPDKKHWGQPITQSKVITLDKAIKGFSAEKPVLIEAKVKKVCKKMGCWMVMENASEDVRVTFEKYAFFVPQNILGKLVQVEGKLKKKEISVAEQKHFLEDEGAPKEKIDKVTSPKSVYSFVATGVRLAKN